MLKYHKHLLLIILFSVSFFKINVFADSHSVNEILEIIQKDLKTLEKAVYSNSSNVNLGDEATKMDQNSEEVLTRHLLKLSEIENQFQQLTNKFEEINFKLDKLSNRMSKVQADNQIRFQDLENNLSSSDEIKKITKTPIVAIGGINSENYKKLLLNNANFLAISGYIWNNKKYKPTEAIESLI